MRTYEELFIVNAAASEEETEVLVEQLRGVITTAGGSLDKVDNWGVRKLAYRVNRQMEGIYILLAFGTPDSATVREIERRLRVADIVMKFITVRMDQRMRRVEKRRKRREKRAARKPQLLANAPPPPAPGTRPESPSPAMPDAPAMPEAPVPAEPAAE